jgi:hypothetical protein
MQNKTHGGFFKFVSMKTVAEFQRKEFRFGKKNVREKICFDEKKLNPLFAFAAEGV